VKITPPPAGHFRGPPGLGAFLRQIGQAGSAFETRPEKGSASVDTATLARVGEKSCVRDQPGSQAFFSALAKRGEIRGARQAIVDGDERGFTYDELVRGPRAGSV